ncbi:MAG: alpha/beta fold hydrolase [Terriglobales bacterium]
MSTFVLIHGAWHGGWVWNTVAGKLRAQGHTVHTPDLPGHGSDKTPVGEVTLQTYADRVAAVIDACPEPVVLAGHSMGGIVISQAAEQRAEQISALVYVCAFLLGNGETLLQWAQPDNDALVVPNLVSSADGNSVTINMEVIVPALYGDCSAEDIRQIKALLVPQATSPLSTPVQLTGGKYGKVPRFYVECLHDRAISIGVQRQMYAAAGCEKVFTLDCDHSPMYSRPAQLANCLMETAQTRPGSKT